MLSLLSCQGETRFGLAMNGDARICIMTPARSARIRHGKELKMASVLITGTSKGIGLETALAFGRAGHKVHATLRNPSRAPELAQTAAREKLPIIVSEMDVDSDQSVPHAIATIPKKHGPIDVLVNNAGIERAGAIEAATGRISCGYGDQLYGRAALHSGGGAADARTAEWMHYQCYLGRGTHRGSAVSSIQRLQMGPGGAERGARSRDENIWCACRNRGTRHHRFGNGAGHFTQREALGVQATRAVCCAFHGFAKKSGATFAGGTKDPGNRREWDLATPSSGGTRCTSFPAMAQHICR
jgi:NAD(P)-dependent dehydrogenase (short-subunit alcohol dehydrogenase family)